MNKSNQNRKRIGKTGWLPFWNGSKFNKRLISKRVRQYNKAIDKNEECFMLWDYSSEIYPKKNYKIDFKTGKAAIRDSKGE